MTEKTQNNAEYKLFFSYQGVQIKLEPNLVIRGAVFPAQQLTLSKKAQDFFEMFVVTQALSFADLYGGKLCAALDRQHPRDLFDVKLLLENEGITEEVKKAFIVYLISHNRPIYELLNPRFKNLKQVYSNEFSGMTAEKISLKELVAVQKLLPKKLLKAFSAKEKQFIISVKEGSPKWELLGIAGIDKLPAVQWKLMNINKMTGSKQKESLKKLEKLLA